MAEGMDDGKRAMIPPGRRAASSLTPCPLVSGSCALNPPTAGPVIDGLQGFLELLGAHCCGSEDASRPLTGF